MIGFLAGANLWANFCHTFSSAKKTNKQTNKQQKAIWFPASRFEATYCPLITSMGTLDQVIFLGWAAAACANTHANVWRAQQEGEELLLDYGYTEDGWTT